MGHCCISKVLSLSRFCSSAFLWPGASRTGAFPPLRPLLLSGRTSKPGVLLPSLHLPEQHSGGKKCARGDQEQEIGGESEEVKEEKKKDERKKAGEDKNKAVKMWQESADGTKHIEGGEEKTKKRLTDTRVHSSFC